MAKQIKTLVLVLTVLHQNTIKTHINIYGQALVVSAKTLQVYSVYTGYLHLARIPEQWRAW